jgi:hypothetical protein
MSEAGFNRRKRCTDDGPPLPTEDAEPHLFRPSARRASHRLGHVVILGLGPSLEQYVDL